MAMQGTGLVRAVLAEIVNLARNANAGLSRCFVERVFKRWLPWHDADSVALRPLHATTTRYVLSCALHGGAVCTRKPLWLRGISKSRGDRIRTCGLLLPKGDSRQAALVKARFKRFVRGQSIAFDAVRAWFARFRVVPCSRPNGTGNRNTLRASLERRIYHCFPE